MSSGLTISQILAADDIVPERVDVPEWGGHIYIRSLTGDERDAFESRFLEGGKSLIGVRRELVAACLCDEEGHRMRLTENERIALGKRSGAVLDRLFSICQRICAMRKEDLNEAEGKSSADATASG